MKIEIEREEGGSFAVRMGDRYQDGLTWDEMLGCIAATTMPRSPVPCQYLRTKEEHAEFLSRLKRIPDDPIEIIIGD